MGLRERKINRLVLGLVCGIYPAFKSSRLTPMEAIRSGLE
jgi:ABC-type lipoprotein release transport system permease subunit